MKKEKTAKRRGGVPAYTKRELVLRVARETELTQEQVHDAVQKSLNIIAETLLSGRAIEFRDFGVFEMVSRKARIGRNPKKPEETVQIPNRKTIKFRPGRKLKALLEKK